MTTITADFFHHFQLPSNSNSSRNDRERGNSTSPTPLASALQSALAPELLQIAHECDQAGWDGYGAKPISKVTCERVAQFVDLLPTWMETPEVSPEPDGEIAIEWYRPNGAVFSISIGEFGPVNYAGLFGRDQEVHGVEQFLGEVPSRLVRLISEFLATQSRF